MFTQEDVNIIANELPSSAVIEISKKTGISRPTIYRFLKGNKIRSRLQERIYMAALKIIERDKIKTQKIKQERSRILSKNFNAD
jgi:predicted transcriptional regulator